MDQFFFPSLALRLTTFQHSFPVARLLQELPYYQNFGEVRDLFGLLIFCPSNLMISSKFKVKKTSQKDLLAFYESVTTRLSMLCISFSAVPCFESLAPTVKRGLMKFGGDLRGYQEMM